jgi:hypothetical protein
LPFKTDLESDSNNLVRFMVSSCLGESRERLREYLPDNITICCVAEGRPCEGGISSSIFPRLCLSV